MINVAKSFFKSFFCSHTIKTTPQWINRKILRWHSLWVYTQSTTVDMKKKHRKTDLCWHGKKIKQIPNKMKKEKDSVKITFSHPNMISLSLSLSLNQSSMSISSQPQSLLVARILTVTFRILIYLSQSGRHSLNLAVTNSISLLKVRFITNLVFLLWVKALYLGFVCLEGSY